MSDTPQNCPCGSKRPYPACCGRFLDGTASPETAEELMRSRYTAHCRGDISWLRKTLAPDRQSTFDPIATAEWATQNQWTGLKILKSRRGRAQDDEGTVLFKASYYTPTGPGTHRENSLFRRIDGRWYYVDAVQAKIRG